MRRQVLFLAVGFAVFAAPTASAQSEEVTIDFSTASHGFPPAPVPKDFYADLGINFTESFHLSFIQGDEALNGGLIAATFTEPVISLSAEVAPGFQGTADYILTARDAAGAIVATTTVTRTEDTGDPADQGSGYFTVDLGTLPRPATSFTLDNRFVRSSFGPPACEGGGFRCFTYGVSSISYTIQRAPTSKNQCKNGGWRNYGTTFKNEGQCVSFVATGGKKQH